MRQEDGSAKTYLLCNQLPEEFEKGQSTVAILAVSLERRVWN